MTASESNGFPLGQVVAANVQRLLESKGMSSEDLARKSGHPLTLVEQILSGQSGGLGLLELQDVAVALGVDAKDLV